MMNPGLDTDPAALGTDGLVVLGLNGVTSSVKDWLEDVLPESVLPLARRGYVVLPVVLAGIVCYAMDGFQFGANTVACATKYGMGAAYLKIVHSKGIRGG